MQNTTLFWWSMLCGVSAVNVLAWVGSTYFLRYRSGSLQPGTWTTTHWHVVLSAGYVLGCAYRSAFPVFDVQRLVMVDSWLSSVVVGRSVATLAELCFAAQWAFLLNDMAQEYCSKTAAKVSRYIVPMIVTAEICCWYAVLTTSNLGHVFESSLWGLSAAMLVASFLLLWPSSHRSHRLLLALVSAFGLTYVAYMFTVDVPMYWGRWVYATGQGHQYLSFSQGLSDVSGRWVVSHNWADWQQEVVWMSLYFSVAVWLSIGIVHASLALSTRNKAIPLCQEELGSVRKQKGLNIAWFFGSNFLSVIGSRIGWKAATKVPIKH
jgi:hypothetical protein